MNRLHLDATEFSMLKQILKSCVPQYTVLAFGSRVTGLCHEGSDLDLVIKNPNHPNQLSSELAHLRSTLQNSNLSILVDVFDWANLPSSFRQEIEKSNIKIQGV